MPVIITEQDALVTRVNHRRLIEECLAAGLPEPIVQHSGPGEYRAEFPDGTDRAAAIAVLQAHDASLQSAEEILQQAAQAIGSGADDEARAIPDFVGWTPAEAQAWVQANVTDLPTARTALVKLAGMVAAINARVFPRIRAERQVGGE